jgi:hypothetical protein
MRKGVIMEQETKDLWGYQLSILEKKVAQDATIICMKGTIGSKPTLVLVDPYNTHNLMSKTVVATLGLSLKSMDPCRILLPNGQIHNINLYLEDVKDTHQFWNMA